MTYLILGAGGQLGFACTLKWQNARAYTHQELDISDSDHLRSVMEEIRPSVIINAGAYTNVEGAETNYTNAFTSNAIGPLVLAKIASDFNSTLVHISTDYVFDGTKEYFTEEDVTHPLNVFGITKLAGEEVVEIYCPAHYIIRTSALFGKRKQDGGDNFVTKRIAQMKKAEPITMVDDQWTTPTYTEDLVECIDSLLSKKAPYGTYHAVNSGGGVTWFEFTQAIVDVLGIETVISPISTDKSDTALNRPRMSVLQNAKLEELGVVMPDWRDALSRYITSLA